MYMEAQKESRYRKKKVRKTGTSSLSRRSMTCANMPKRWLGMKTTVMKRESS